MAAGRKRPASIEDADVVEPEKSALKNVAAFLILAVHPPGEVQHELVKGPLEENAIPCAAAFFFDAIDAQASPCVHRRGHPGPRPRAGRGVVRSPCRTRGHR